MVQDTGKSPLRAISLGEIRGFIESTTRELRDVLRGVLQQFVEHEATPVSLHELENQLFVALRESGRQLMQQVVDNLEVEEVESMPVAVEYDGNLFRRLAEKTPRADVVTRFGKIAFQRTRYRNGRAGKCIFPLEIALGIEHGFTPAAAELIGQQFASTGSSQGRTLAAINEQFGCSIGAEKLRKLTEYLSEATAPFREVSQLEQLQKWMDQAREAGNTPVLSVSRDGVSLGIAPFATFEMASVATISVLSGGRRLGTVYLGRAPETNQQTLSDQLTSLLRETIRSCGEALPHVVYVTDAGKVETAYWKNVMRKFYVDGRRIKVYRVLDYYHASLRLTTLADALNVDAAARLEWLKHVRKLLLLPGGWGRVMRSFSTMQQRHGYKPTHAEEARKALRYLRRYRRFMNYHQMKAQGFPRGSGIVESACKQIVSERLKLSGMRWLHRGAQHVLNLRCLLLSGVWRQTYKKLLASKSPVATLIKQQAA